MDNNLTAQSPSALAVPRRGLRRPDAAAYVGVGQSKFDEMVTDGRMPQPKRVDSLLIYDRRAIDYCLEIARDDPSYFDDRPSGLDLAREADRAHLVSSEVYFIEGFKRVKIGYSTSTFRRLLTLQAGSPVPLTLLGTMPGAAEVEAYLHERFSADRLHGEWFTLTPAIRQFIEDHCS